MRQDWKYLPLKEIAGVQNGFAFEAHLFNTAKKGIPLIRIRDIKRSYTETYTTEICPDDFKVYNGDLLIGMDGDFNVCLWNGGDALLNQRVCKILPSEKISISFLYYLLPFPLKEINDKTPFATVKHLSSKQVLNINIPVPPLAEQERIVALLDDQFAKIDQLKANADLQLQAAKDLFQSALKEMLTPQEGWEKGCIGSIATILHGKNQKEVEDPTGKYPIYGSGGNIMGYSNEYLCEEGTTILGRKGTINNPTYISEKFWNVDTAFGICAKKGVDKKFLYYIVKSINWQEKNTGTTLPSLTQTVVLSFSISFPSLAEQERIAARLDEISEKVKALQTNYDQTITLCNDLKQSLLKSIFA